MARRELPSPSFGGALTRLEIADHLRGHSGCVNTCAWTRDGRFVLTGSDDTRIIVHDAGSRKPALRWDSQHTGNVFGAKCLDASVVDGARVVSCAADGQVRLHRVKDGGVRVGSRLLFRHAGRAHKLAVAPASVDVLASAGEDGKVALLDVRTSTACHVLTLRGGDGGAIGLNIVDFSPVNEHLLLTAGSEAAVRVFDVRWLSSSRGAAVAAMQPPGAPSRRVLPAAVAYCPAHMRGEVLADAAGGGTAAARRGRSRRPVSAHVTSEPVAGCAAEG